MKNINSYFLNGVKESYPIILGYLPIGIAFGALANSTGISPLGVLFISLVLFAGSAQFITVSLLAGLTNGISIIATVFVVNFRHFLMSSSYSKYFRNEKNSILALLSFFVTDESFAIGINKAKYDNEEFNSSYLLGLQLSGYFSWAIFTTIGAIVGSYIVNFETFGLDFALPAMFIGLLALLIKNKRDLVLCILSGILGVYLYTTPLQSYSIIISAVLISLILVGGSND